MKYFFVKNKLINIYLVTFIIVIVCHKWKPFNFFKCTVWIKKRSHVKWSQRSRNKCKSSILSAKHIKFGQKIRRCKKNAKIYLDKFGFVLFGSKLKVFSLQKLFYPIFLKTFHFWKCQRCHMYLLLYPLPLHISFLKLFTKNYLFSWGYKWSWPVMTIWGKLIGHDHLRETGKRSWLVMTCRKR